MLDAPFPFCALLLNADTGSDQARLHLTELKRDRDRDDRVCDSMASPRREPRSWHTPFPFSLVKCPRMASVAQKEAPVLAARRIHVGPQHPGAMTRNAMGRSRRLTLLLQKRVGAFVLQDQIHGQRSGIKVTARGMAVSEEGKTRFFHRAESPAAGQGLGVDDRGKSSSSVERARFTLHKKNLVSAGADTRDIGYTCVATTYVNPSRYSGS